MPASVQSPPTLRQFGKYLLDQEIARGGMARVYLARLRGLGGFEKKLVVKQILPELATDPRFIEMFVEEAKTLVQMSHPHIVPVYELGVVDGVYFLAMEFVDGATLAEILCEGPLPATLTARLGMQICDALSYSHERFELVHRDVTPRNVIVDSLGHAYLLDFGIATRAEGTLVGEVFGSHGYMSPEQARGEIAGPPSDLFSLGTVLYESLTNRPAFLRGTPEQTRVALLEEPPPKLAGEDAIPSDLTALVDETLRTRPEERPTSAKLMGKKLRAFLAVYAPEGVAPELGDRALAAMKARHRKPAEEAASIEVDGSGGAAARTIATSVTLRKILGGHGEDTTERHIEREAEVPVPEARTLPIPGRTSSQAGTVPIPERRPKQAEPAPTPARGQGWLIAGSLIMAILAATGYWFAVDQRSGAEDSSTGDLDAATADAASSDGSTAAGSSEDGAPTTLGPESADGGFLDGALARSADAAASLDASLEDGSRDTETQAAVVEAARISISAQPWGEYRLDRAALGTEAVRDRAIPAGRHTLRITNDSLGKSADVTFEAGPGEALRALVNFNDAEPAIQITRRRGP